MNGTVYTNFTDREKQLFLNLLMLDISVKPVREHGKAERVMSALALAYELGYTKTERLLETYYQVLYHPHVKVPNLTKNFDPDGGHVGMADLHKYEMPLKYDQITSEELMYFIRTGLVDWKVWFTELTEIE